MKEEALGLFSLFFLSRRVILAVWKGARGCTVQTRPTTSKSECPRVWPGSLSQEQTSWRRWASRRNSSTPRDGRDTSRGSDASRHFNLQTRSRIPTRRNDSKRVSQICVFAATTATTFHTFLLQAQKRQESAVLK